MAVMGEILIGTCSWTDRTLIESGRFYPAWARSAEARLQYYASRFSIVKVDSSYYALPNEKNRQQTFSFLRKSNLPYVYV